MNSILLVLHLVATNKVEIQFHTPGPGIYSVESSTDRTHWRGVAAEIVAAAEPIGVIDRAVQPCTIYRVKWWGAQP